MEENLILVENKEKRAELIHHQEVLDKVKVLTFLTKDLVVTTKQVANYFEVGEKAINSLIQRHKEELETNGMTILKGQELKEFKGKLQGEVTLNEFKYVSQLTLFTKRTILNVGMLLTESKVAEKVREYLLNLEDKATIEQKKEAVKDLIESERKKLELKLVKKEAREYAKNIEIEKTIERCCDAYNMCIEEASIIVQQAIVNKKSIEEAILESLKIKNELSIEKARGSIRETVDHVAVQFFDGDREMVYHYLSEKMRYKIGYNMRAQRSKLKAANDKRKDKGTKLLNVPSYLDIIVEKDAFIEAYEALDEIVREKQA